MKRLIEQELVAWKNTPECLPLLIRGARQIGKTFVVEKFARKHFEYFVNINFELDPEFSICFQTLKPQEIISNITLRQEIPIINKKTLLFLDEIQLCPNAIMALRYFKEQMPELHVIGAGSLLEFALKDEEFHMPVGRVQYLYMQPLSFAEFLLAQNKKNLIEHLNQSSLAKPPSEIAHKELLDLVRKYFILGGMPAVIDSYIKYNNLNMCQNLQSGLLATYRDDFGKYAKHAQHKYLQLTFNRIPNLIGKPVKYTHIDNNTLSRDIKNAISLLGQAGILHQIYAANCSGLPLNALINGKKFKLLFLDIGLTNRAGKINMDSLFAQNLMLVNQGALAEQFVGQELLAYQNPYEKPELLFWARDKKGSQAEVDYVIDLDGKILPIEVKAGKTGRLKSLKQFLAEKKSNFGIRISSQPLIFNDNILSIPLYMIQYLPSLVSEIN